MLWFVCLPACLPCGFCAFNQLFMANVPDHWCKIPELDNFTEYRRNFSKTSCQRYKINWTDIILREDVINVDYVTILNDVSTLELESCLDGWEYDTDRVTSSIVIDVGK